MSLQLRIYPQFAEHRETLILEGDFVRVFDQQTWEHLLPDSLDLEGLEVAGIQRRRLPAALSLWEGQWLTLSTPHTQQKVRLISALDQLVQDQDGRFFYINPQDLMFPQQPAPTGEQHEVRFLVAQPGEGVLSYLTRAVHWTARFSLQVQEEQGLLVAWADVSNQTSQSLQVDHAELVAGDVPLLEDFRETTGYGVAAAGGMERAAGVPRVQQQHEQAGLQVFPLEGGFVLLPHGTTSVQAFADPVQVKVRAGLRLRTHRHSSRMQGKLQRWYEFESPRTLPAGKMTVRSENTVVGQHWLEARPRGSEVRVVVGFDPEVSYQREVEVLRSNRQHTTCRYHLHLHNPKNRAMEVQFIDDVLQSAPQVNVLGEGFAETPEGLRFEATLAPGASASFQYTVDFRDRV